MSADPPRSSDRDGRSSEDEERSGADGERETAGSDGRGSRDERGTDSATGADAPTGADSTTDADREPGASAGAPASVAVDADGASTAARGERTARNGAAPAVDDDVIPTIEEPDARGFGDDDRFPTFDEPGEAGVGADDGGPDAVPADVRSYERFQKVDGATYERVNGFLRDRTYVTAREWAIARLCADFRTETGVEMTKIGENLPTLVPFMTDTYTPQAVNQARSSFESKVTKAGATFLYGAMCDFFTAEELDDLMYEVTEVAKFLLEVEGVELDVDDELDAEERISTIMRDVRRASRDLRYDGVECPHCGVEFRAATEGTD